MSRICVQKQNKKKFKYRIIKGTQLKFQYGIKRTLHYAHNTS